MPKRSTHTFESEKDGVRDTPLQSAYCLYCGACCLVVDAPLDTLPRRRTDGAPVLDRDARAFKVLAAAGDKPVLVKREAGVERQWRHACAKCGLPVAYRCEPSASARLTYLVPDALGPHPSTTGESAVPKAFQLVSARGVRVAFEVSLGAPSAGVARIGDTEVLAHVRAPSMREGAAGELLELCATALRVPRHRLQLTRGWSHKSKFVLVSGLSRGEVYQRLRAAIDTSDGSYARALLGAKASAAAGGDGAGDERESALNPGAGAVASSIRQQWEAGEDDLAGLPLAPPPETGYKARW